MIGKKMNWYFIDKTNIKVSEHIDITGPEHHHLSRVKREKVGKEIIIFNGKDYPYISEIISIDRKKTCCIIKGVAKKDYNSNNIGLTLVLSSLAVNKLKTILHSIIPINVREIIIIRDQLRSVSNHSDINLYQILRKTAIESCKTAMLYQLPVIKIVAFNRFIEEQTKDDNAIKLLCSLDKDSTNLIDLPITGKVKDLIYYIGPEGGMSVKEQLSLIHSGFEKCRFGSTRFTSVLACVVFGSILNYRLIQAKKFALKQDVMKIL